MLPGPFYYRARATYAELTPWAEVGSSTLYALGYSAVVIVLACRASGTAEASRSPATSGGEIRVSTRPARARAGVSGVVEDPPLDAPIVTAFALAATALERLDESFGSPVVTAQGKRYL